jgi:soluble lytic murein transglycosylase
VEARAKENDLPAALVYAVMRQESGFDPEAVSPARAVGLLQLLPETARAVASETPDPDDDGSRLTSPALNIALGTRYLKDLLARFHGVTPLAVAAYNAGPDAVTRWLSRRDARDKSAADDLDLFVERIPFAETRTYVARVMGNMARYAYVEGGASAVPALQLNVE